MGLWVLEPKSTENVPGTVYVERETEQVRELTSNLKHGTGKDSHLILVPQPSDSPNDPLNWSHREKIIHSWVLSIGAGLASGTCLFLNPSHAVMMREIGTTMTQLSRSVSWLMMSMGIASVLSTPLARIYGKRPVFLFLSILGIIGYAIVLADPTNMTYIFVGRSLWGAGMSALEYLVSSSVGDLFYVHQRGFHLALWHFALSGGNSFGQVLASQIVQGQDYVWAFRYAVIFMSIYVVVLFLFVPETTYNRPARFDTDIHEVLAADEFDASSQTTPPSPSQEKQTTGIIDVSEPPANEEKRKSFLSSLRLYNGKFSNENYIQAVLSPFATLLLPAVNWTAYSYGITVAFAAAVSVCLAQIFTAPPYNFSTSAVGLTVLSPFVGNILGNFIPGPIADWLVTYMSRKNGGVYEPEFRNLLCIPSLITGAAGFWGFGLSIHYRLHWFVPVFFWGLASFAGSTVALVANTYVLDCHRKYAQDAYAVIGLVKSVMGFAIAFFINNWLKKEGPIQVFFVVGSIHVAGCIYGLVLYVWGKKIRLAVAKSKFINTALRLCGNS